MLCHEGVHSEQCPTQHEHSSFVWPFSSKSTSGDPKPQPEAAGTDTSHWNALKFAKCAKCAIGHDSYSIIRKDCIKEHPFSDQNFPKSWRLMNNDQLKCAQEKLDAKINAGDKMLKDTAAKCRKEAGCSTIIKTNELDGTQGPPSEDHASIDDLSSLVLLRTLTQLRSARSGGVFL